uniref:Zinc finger protein 622 n=1 Tax=Petromyzon marinus TaxID=7757 RepID=S4R473_PETMA
MSAFTCMSCRVAFACADLQRAHYKTDWHRYNLKRKVAQMAPVTAESFAERVLAQRAAAQVPGAVVHQPCATCGKGFASHNAYDNHLRSHRHLQAEARQRDAAQAAHDEVERMNKKNVEKGLEIQPLSKDEMNAAIQQAVFKASPHKSPSLARRRTNPRAWPVGATPPRKPTARQGRRPHPWSSERHRSHPATDEWEDLGTDKDDDDDDWEEEEDDEDEGAVDMELGATTEGAEGAVLSADGQPAMAGTLPHNGCFFCPQRSRTLARSLAHMSREHGFFIPDVQYLVDLPGLMRYLGEKVGAGNVCLWCNEKGRSFYSLDAVRKHMRDKGHCKLFTDGDAALEFADFYDFRGRDVDGEDEEDDEEDSRLGEKQLVETTMELQLPSGVKVGHRSLLVYYRQRFAPGQAVVVHRSGRLLGRVMQQYRALGWNGNAGGEAAMRRQRDMRFLQRHKAKWAMKMGMRGNMLQHHFRSQVPI